MSGTGLKVSSNNAAGRFIEHHGTLLKLKTLDRGGAPVSPRMGWWLMVVMATAVTLAAGDPDELHVGRVIRQILFPGQGSGQPGSGSLPRPPAGCNCETLVKCAAFFLEFENPCPLANGEIGVCCPSSPSTASGRPESPIGVDISTLNRDAATRFNVDLDLRNLDVSALTRSSTAGLQATSTLQSIEARIIEENNILERFTPALGHLRQSRTRQTARDMDKRAWSIAIASTNMLQDLNLTPSQAGLGLRRVRVSSTDLAGMCPPDVTCNQNGIYRTADGSCNNLRETTWGQSNTPAQRILPPTYEDGVSEPRATGVNGNPLPNERRISNSILIDGNIEDKIFTSSVMQWAQFMDHDFAHIPFPSLENGDGIQCCPPTPGLSLHPRCFPVDITGDPFYSRFNQTCMNVIRSMLAIGPGEDCTFGFAEQLNQLTHWIDGSTVYGSDDAEQRALRSFRNGKLRTSSRNLLPIDEDQGGECEAESRGARCFLAGESRVNEQPGLTAMHVLWLREHNRVAEQLQRINPGWSDERVFQETRRIIIGEIQHITYNEWLPIILGRRFVFGFGLNVLRSGFSDDYNPSINPNMNNEFSTAAFRFGHSLVQGDLSLFSESGSMSTVQLRNHFNSPHLIQNEGRLDELIRSLVLFPTQSFDRFVTQELSNHLFQTPRFDFGMDLMTINIHRGRDHGIATYNSIREVCGLVKATSFKDIEDQIDPRTVRRLSQLYDSVDDIDFFVGGMSETPMPGSLLGWTFVCVVGDQFARLKKGDRFFYDLRNQVGSFTLPQLDEIRKSSWARIICDNSPISAVQPLAFWQAGGIFNQQRPCTSRSIPSPDFRPWAEGGGYSKY